MGDKLFVANAVRLLAKQAPRAEAVKQDCPAVGGPDGKGIVRGANSEAARQAALGFQQPEMGDARRRTLRDDLSAIGRETERKMVFAWFSYFPGWFPRPVEPGELRRRVGNAVQQYTAVSDRDIHLADGCSAA